MEPTVGDVAVRWAENIVIFGGAGVVLLGGSACLMYGHNKYFDRAIDALTRKIYHLDRDEKKDYRDSV